MCVYIYVCGSFPTLSLTKIEPVLLGVECVRRIACILLHGVLPTLTPAYIYICYTYKYIYMVVSLPGPWRRLSLPCRVRMRARARGPCGTG